MGDHAVRIGDHILPRAEYLKNVSTPGAPCSRCGGKRYFIQRAKGDELCAPCRRAANDSNNHEEAPMRAFADESRGVVDRPG